MVEEKNTQVLSAMDLDRDSANIDRAAEVLRAGGLVAMPTETVYGLAANALDPDCVHAIYAAKGRPSDNPLIVHISDLEMLPPLVREIPPKAKELMERFWPGPLTIILPKSDKIPSATSGGLDTVAIRMPSHPVARELIRRSGLPLAAPSANLSGSPSTTTAQHCIQDLTGRVDVILDAGPSEVGLESTVLTMTTVPPRILRPGAVTREQLAEVLGRVEIDPAVTNPLGEGQKAASPGMKYKHYSPKANVIIVEGERENFVRFLNSKAAPGVYGMVFTGESEGITCPCLEFGGNDDPAQQAHDLFRDLRKMDELGASTVYVRCPEKTGVGLAVYNRLLRAAAFEVIKV